MADIVVLGCGPSGLMAAKAIDDLGHNPVIMSRKRKSDMPGAMYVHEPVPGVNDGPPKAQVFFYKLGTREGYAAKVYGDPEAPCSWDTFPEGPQPAWCMREAYDRLWDMYESLITDVNIDQSHLYKLTRRYIVVSTIPGPLICEGDHIFTQAHIWVRRNFPAHRLDPDIKDPCIVYNGDPAHAWYRGSSLFGHAALEFGHHVEHAEQGVKPIGHNCDCNPEVIRVGRFGAWKKGILITDAYKATKEALS